MDRPALQKPYRRREIIQGARDATTGARPMPEILKMRDQLVVMRERLFQLTAATAARTKKVDGLLIDCAGAGRVFGVRIVDVQADPTTFSGKAVTTG